MFKDKGARVGEAGEPGSSCRAPPEAVIERRWGIWRVAFRMLADGRSRVFRRKRSSINKLLPEQNFFGAVLAGTFAPAKLTTPDSARVVLMSSHEKVRAISGNGAAYTARPILASHPRHSKNSISPLKRLWNRQRATHGESPAGRQDRCLTTRLAVA
jgi:hypothetical protein